MNIQNLSELEQAAAAGDAAAMTDLGARLLSGNDGTFMPQQGADWLAAAAKRGSGEACARVAVLAGTGVCRPQSWDIALDYLQRSAELGWRPAQQELALLASNEKPMRRDDEAISRDRFATQRSPRRRVDVCQRRSCGDSRSKNAPHGACADSRGEMASVAVD